MSGAHPQNPTVSAFLLGMRELGYVYDENFVTEVRGTDGKPELFPRLAADLVRSKPDVIVAVGPSLGALKRETSTIPVVMSAASDPVASGLVQSLARPGGNFTGLSLQAIETTGKRLELLKELVPGNAPVGMVWDRPSIAYWEAAQRAARSKDWKVVSLEISSDAQIASVFKRAGDAGARSLLVTAAGLVFPRRWEFAELASRSGLPAMYELRPYAEAGGLVSYGVDIYDVWKDAALFVDKILKGANPGTLPVEQPTKFELIINLAAAKALSLKIPQSLLLRADEVIQ